MPGEGGFLYAPVHDLCSAIAFWSGSEPGDPADVVLFIILPPDAELTWRMVRDIVRSEVVAKIGRPAVLWPPRRGPIVVSELHHEVFDVISGAGKMCGMIFHYRVPHPES